MSEHMAEFPRRPDFLVRTSEGAPLGHIPGLEGADAVNAAIKELLDFPPGVTP